jgi:pectate lyase
VRTGVLMIGGLIVVVLVVIFAVSALKGGSSTPSASQSSTAGETAGSTSATTTHTTRHRAVATNPAQTSVVVLNGTATAGLAHHLASDLQQSGYTHALASAAVPPGTHQSTVVEYSSGHRADAKGVAGKLNVTQVQPMDSTIAGMAGSATVVVLAGADQAALLGGGGAHSQGEPAAGGGEAATG